MISKEAKADYDREYRRKNRARLKVARAAYFQRTYDPKKAAIERKKNMPKHVEYCRQPEYKAWKKLADDMHFVWDTASAGSDERSFFAEAREGK